MATQHSNLAAIAVFAAGIWVVQVVPPLTAHAFGLGHPVTDAQRELLVEVSTLTAVAATAGFAVARCSSVLRALCAIPIAGILVYLIPGRVGLWLSESFRSVVVNMLALALVFAVVGAISGWLVSRFARRGAGHA